MRTGRLPPATGLAHRREPGRGWPPASCGRLPRRRVPDDAGVNGHSGPGMAGTAGKAAIDPMPGCLWRGDTVSLGMARRTRRPASRLISQTGRIGVTRHNHDARAPVPGGARRALGFRAFSPAQTPGAWCVHAGGVKDSVKACPSIGQRRSVAVDHPAGPPGWIAPVSGRGEGLLRNPRAGVASSPGVPAARTPQAGQSPGPDRRPRWPAPATAGTLRHPVWSTIGAPFRAALYTR